MLNLVHSYFIACILKVHFYPLNDSIYKFYSITIFLRSHFFKQLDILIMSPFILLILPIKSPLYLLVIQLIIKSLIIILRVMIAANRKQASSDVFVLINSTRLGWFYSSQLILIEILFDHFVLLISSPIFYPFFIFIFFIVFIFMISNFDRMRDPADS